MAQDRSESLEPFINRIYNHTERKELLCSFIFTLHGRYPVLYYG